MRSGFFLTITALFFTNLLYAQTPGWAWAKAATGGNSLAYDNAPGKNGSSYNSGFFIGTCTFGNNTFTSHGNIDMFVAKYDASGNVLWAKQVGGNNIDEADRMVTDDSGNVYIQGVCSNNVMFGNFLLSGGGSFLAKYDPDGNVLWAKDFPTPIVNNMAIDTAANLYLTGAIPYGTTTFGNIQLQTGASEDIFTAKYDRNGQVIWATGGGSNQLTQHGYVIVADSDGTACYAGMISDTVTGLSEKYIGLRDASGQHVWTKTIAGTAYWTLMTSLLPADNGRFLLTGTYGDGTLVFGNTTLSAVINKAFLAKYNSDGTVAWAKNIGEGITLNDAVRDNAGNIYIAGNYDDSTYVGNMLLLAPFTGGKLYAAKFDGNGNFLWVQTAVSPNGDASPTGITTDNGGNIWLSGSGNYEFVFGNTHLNAQPGLASAFQAKLSASAGVPAVSVRPDDLVVYPNPASGVVNISMPVQTIAAVNLYDASGRKISASPVSAQQSNLQINVNALAAGTYFLEFQKAQGGIIGKPLVIQK